MKEIERKFLVVSDAWRAEAGRGTLYLQAYVAAENGNSVRVRILGDGTATLTVKTGSGMVREEFEYPVPVSDARRMLQCAIGVLIEKTRYFIAHEGFVWEVDLYHGALEGLVVAEVEMDNEDDDPPLPDWVGREVTDESAWSNSALSLYGRPEEDA